MKKSIKELAWNVTEEEYRADKAISYSTLSRFEREGWRKLSSLFDRIETPALTFGSAVDTILTDGEEAFNEKFIVCSFPSLSDNLISITKILHSRYKDEYRRIDMIPEDVISDVAVSQNYYTGASYANYRVKNVKEKCNEYYSLLSLAEGKTILSQSDYDDAMKCVTELRTNVITSWFFTHDEWNDKVEKVFQLKFKAEYEGIPVRCMFDELIIDHQNKVIYPIDLKTTGYPEEEFEHSFVSWRYDIQAKLYTYILKQVIKDDPYFKDFKIQFYQFIVINRRTCAPLIWEFKSNFNELDMKDKEGNVLRDWRKILVDLNYYLENPNVKYSREAGMNEGVMTISIN